MEDPSLPAPRPLDPDDPVRPEAVVLAAVALDPPLDERRAWLDRHEVVDAFAVPGAEEPLYLTAEGIAIGTTGLGKSDAATTVATLCASPGVDLDAAAVVCSTGIAGGPPDRVSLGSVVIADAVVDWDRKHRWDPDGDRVDGPGNGADDPSPIDRLAYRPRDYVHEVNPTLVDAAVAAARRVDLRDAAAVRAYQRRYPDAPDEGPTVTVGTSVCGDEYWHGERLARQVDRLCEAYDVGPYVATQMEDAATATALERFGLGDRYLSVRAVANYDRPAPDETVAESFDGIPESLDQGIENAARVGSAVVEALCDP